MENCDIWIVSEIYLQPASFGITLLFHFSERAGKAAGTRKSSRQSWLCIAWCQCAILYPESLRVSAYAVCKNMRHNVLCLIFLLVCLFGVETSRLLNRSLCCVFCVLCSALGFMVFCVCVCSAFSLAQSPLHVLSCLLFPVCCAWRLVCYMDDFLVWFALYACIRYMYVHICMYIYI